MIERGVEAFRMDPRLLAQQQDGQALRGELVEVRRRFESVLGSLPGVFYRCELSSPWRMSFVSEGIEALTGYGRAELEQQNGWADIMLTESRSEVESAVAQAVVERRSFDLGYAIMRKTGEVRWVSERGHPVLDHDGKPIFLEGVITDVTGCKEADDLQHTMLEHWRRTLDAIPQMVWTMAGDGSDEFYNAQWLRFTGCRIGTTEELSRADLIHPEDRLKAIAAWKEKFANGEPYEAQYRLKHVDGGYRWILSRGEPEKDVGGNTVRWYGTCTDIHEEVLVRQALQASEAVNRSMIEASPDCISLLDIGGNTQFLNRAAIATMDLKSSVNLLGLPWAAGFPASFRGPAERAISQAAAGRTGRFTSTEPKLSGQRWWDIVVAPISGDSAELSGFICIARDITNQKTSEKRIRWTANHDPLTQLPNRALFQRTLDRCLIAAQESGRPVTVLMMDLDDFKRTNDALGHDAGDALLTEFATRLRQSVRADDMIARLGGDEFAVILQGAGGDAEVKAAVQSITARLKAPCEFDGKLFGHQDQHRCEHFPASWAHPNGVTETRGHCLVRSKKRRTRGVEDFPARHAG